MVMEKMSLWIFAGNFAPNLMTDLGVKMEIFAKFVAN